MNTGDEDFSSYEDEIQNQIGVHDIDRNPLACSRFVNTTFLINGERNGIFAWLLASGLFIEWTPIHHIFLQSSQAFLLLLFLLPSHKPLVRFLGICYSVAFFCFGFWILKSLDIITWAASILFVNFFYLVGSFCRSLCHSYSKELEQVYKQIFEKLHITRDQFKKILSCKKTTRILLPNAPYAVEKSTRVDSLGLLLSGRLLVSQQGRPLHIILPLQFIDSPEYFGVSTDELFQVTITALEESKVLVWHRDKLRLTIMSDEYLSLLFDHIIGRDVVRKLIQVSDTVTLPNGTKESSNETDPMLHGGGKDLNGGQFGCTTSPFESGSLSFFTFYKRKAKMNIFTNNASSNGFTKGETTTIC